MTQQQEDKQSNPKMGKGPEQTLFQGQHTGGPQTYEKKMLKIISPLREAN